MRVLQLIDSLHAGGAERMAVTIANELAYKIDRSFICTTREEGILKSTISKEVIILRLNKKGKLDLVAFSRLYRFVQKNNIEVIHAHSTSFFFGTFLKLFLPKLKLVWHDHYGKSEMLSLRKFKILKWCSAYFDAIFSVNEMLKDWAVVSLKCKNVEFMSNFVSIIPSDHAKTKLLRPDSFKIVCLANLRPQKNHFLLLKAFQRVHDQFENSTLHLIGGYTDAVYKQSIINFVTQQKIKEVYFYGEQTNIVALLKEADVGVLASISEGLPISLLEYGLANLAVVSTDVGQCRGVIKEYGKIVASDNLEELCNALLYYIENKDKKETDAKLFSKHINDTYTAVGAIEKIISVYNSSPCHKKKLEK